MAILVAFVNPFVVFLSSIPNCVMGGVCMALYGFIAVSGLKMVQKVDLEDNRNLFVVSAILISGIGGLSLTIALGKRTSPASKNYTFFPAGRTELFPFALHKLSPEPAVSDRFRG